MGGLDWNSKSRAPNSAFGSDSSDPSDRTTVRMFGPNDVWDFNINNVPNFGIVSGTSEATPFVAGVAALVMAANPSLSADEVDGILMRTAHTSPDPTVPRYVNAFEAVKAGLGGSVPPTLTILSPLSAITRPQDHMIEFQARAVNSGLQNISSNIGWTSDVPSDNPLPGGSYWVANDGANPQFSLPPAVHTITASVTDQGWTDHSMVTVTVTAVPLMVDIGSPWAQSHFFPADNVLLSGHSHYLEGRTLPDASVSWSDSTTGTSLGTGHGPIFVRAGTLCPQPPCQHTLVFTGVADAMTATASVAIFIDPTPTTTPPHVTIDTPADHTTFTGQFIGCVPANPRPGVIPIPVFSATVNLQGHATDQNGVAIPDSSITWHKYRADGPLLGTGPSITANIAETQLSATPISVDIFLVALDNQRNAGSMSRTINIATRPVPCQ